MSTLADERAERLKYGPDAPVPIFQHEYEFATLLDIYRERRPLRVLEVGTYHGGTLYHWLQNARPGAVIVSVDSYMAGVDNRHLYAEWTPAGVTLHVLCGDSRDPDIIMAAAEHGAYDWTFIDAGHYYDEVQADWENYRPLTGPGGLIAFHDILPPSPSHPEIQVDRLWREIQRAGHVTREIVADPDADWGGLGVVYL